MEGARWRWASAEEQPASGKGETTVMKLLKSGILWAVIVACAGSGARAQAGAGEARPKAVAPAPIEDVGVVYRGETIKHAFTIQNQGTAPLEIREVDASCGCTVARFDRTIAPGQSGNIRTEVETEDFRGPIAKSVRVYTNDPENPEIQLVVKANIKAHLEADPGYARFVVVEGEPREASRQLLSSPDFADLEIVRIESPSPHLRVAHRPAAAEEARKDVQGKQWQIEIALDTDTPVGAIADNLVVHTNHPRQKTVEIPVAGFVRPILQVSPPVADFGRREIEAPVKASLEVRNHSVQAIAVTAVETDLPAVKAEVKPLKEGRHYQVQLTLAPGLPKGEFRGKLTIRTSSPKEPVLEVELKGVIL